MVSSVKVSLLSKHSSYLILEKKKMFKRGSLQYKNYVITQ